MIRMIPQPIIDIHSKEVNAQEWLCRPKQGTVQEYFQVIDPIKLWEREAACIFQAKKQRSSLPKLMNITLSSLPYFLETDWTWEGGIEITEWGPNRHLQFKILPQLISKIKERGLTVWVDDLTPKDWLNWRYVNVDGYKITINDLRKMGNFNEFLKEVQSKGKPIIVEGIETKEDEDEIGKRGVQFAQGFYYENQHERLACKA